MYVQSCLMSLNPPPNITQDGAAPPHLSCFTISLHGIIFHGPSHGAKAPHESDAGARWRGLVLATLLPLVLCAQTWPMENESGGWVLAIMWPSFIHKKRQSSEHCRRRSGWFWSGDAMEVGCMGRMPIHHFDHQVK